MVIKFQSINIQIVDATYKDKKQSMPIYILGVNQ
ncbi:MAG: hypothetical protein ACJAZP_001876 [Psychromonas sp.]|jgi:hypothetical protein